MRNAADAPETRLGTSCLGELLEELAAPHPVPGGIGATAVLGGLATALAVYVGRLTVGKPGYEPLAEEMERLVDRAIALQAQLVALHDQEATAFNQVACAASLPRQGASEQQVRKDCLRLAARALTQVPLTAGHLATEALGVIEALMRYGNQELLADAGTALAAAGAAIRAARWHVLANAPAGLGDDAWLTESRDKAEGWLLSLALIEGSLSERLEQAYGPKAG